MNSSASLSILPLDHELNQVFSNKKRNRPYQLISMKTKSLLREEFRKDPHPKSFLLQELSKKTGLDKAKVQDWFKYQRKAMQKKGLDTNVKSIKKRHKFNAHHRNLLEKSFKKNPKLNDETLNLLYHYFRFNVIYGRFCRQELLKCESIHIKRWFYYRNRKLYQILKNRKMTKETETSFQTKWEDSPKMIEKEQKLSNFKQEPIVYADRYSPEMNYLQIAQNLPFSKQINSHMNSNFANNFLFQNFNNLNKFSMMNIGLPRLPSLEMQMPTPSYYPCYYRYNSGLF